MKPLSAAELLEVWERGSAQPPPLAAVTMLSAATGEAPEAVARIPAGTRDVQLLAIYRALRGRRVEGLASCPACGENVETAFDVDALLDAIGAELPKTIECAAGDQRAAFRLPTTEDLLAVTALGSRAAMRDALLRRCLVGGDADAATPELLDAAEAAMERADPASDVRFVLACPACAHEWEVAFDAPSFVWTEIARMAERVANDVHLLASAYGWRERDILEMTAARRRLYIRQAYG